MTLLMRDQENLEKGENKMLKLIQKLIVDKRFDDISKIENDSSYRKKLYLEYNISD